MPIGQGEQLTVIGEMDDYDFDAFEIRRANGEIIRTREPFGQAPWNGGRRRR